VPVYDPDAPYADDQGDGGGAQRRPDQRGRSANLARVSFASNAMVVRTYAEMMKTLLEVGQPSRR
jgi:hypothetical protein